jgi:hypothetical protein
MATRTIRIDDLDGSTDAREVTFALDGTTYQLDLSEANVSVLRDTLAPFIQVARRVKGPAQLQGQQPPQRTKAQRAIIREWAIGEGLMTRESRGRIPESVAQAYESKH